MIFLLLSHFFLQLTEYTLEENNWYLGILVNGPNNVTTANLSLVSVENDDWNTFDKKISSDMPNLNDLSKFFLYIFELLSWKNQVIRS